MLDDNEMVYPECHCCPDALSEIRMMKVMSSDVEEIPLIWLHNITGLSMKENIRDSLIFSLQKDDSILRVSQCVLFSNGDRKQH